MIINIHKNGFALYINTRQMKKTGGGTMKPTEITEVIRDLEDAIKQLNNERKP